MKISSRTLCRVTLGVVLTGRFTSGMAQALPWETPITTVATSLTGPVAKGIGVVALAVAGGMLAFGGELSDFTKRILMVVLSLAVMLMASQFLTLFGV